MTFEEEKQAEAMKALQETEKRCESNDGFLKVMKRKIKKKSKVRDLLDILNQTLFIAHITVIYMQYEV